MANTGNTQQQIDYGAVVNDGTGDPLRTAFIKTDDNFDNVAMLQEEGIPTIQVSPAGLPYLR
jgi:hypothetical protein